MVRRGLSPSRAHARTSIEAGLVTVDGAPASKPSRLVHGGEAVSIAGPPSRYVSRGGDKLAHALDRFGVVVDGRFALDAGASTGGFTDCLLQSGASRVIAVDVGYGQMHDRLRKHPRVDVRERTHVRDLRCEDLRVHPDDPLPDLLVADLSFIALSKVLGGLLGLVAPVPSAEAVVLVKPQFEAERADVGRGGVVRDPSVWHDAVQRVVRAAQDAGWEQLDVTASPLKGPKGNVEFLVHLGPRATHGMRTDEVVDARIQAAIAEAQS